VARRVGQATRFALKVTVRSGRYISLALPRHSVVQLVFPDAALLRRGTFQQRRGVGGPFLFCLRSSSLRLWRRTENPIEACIQAD
jgi:hypothetical protein